VADTLLLTRSDVEALLDIRELLPRLREAFASYSLSRVIPARRYPVPLPVPAPAGSNGMILAPGLIAGTPAFTVKVNFKFPGQDPAILGLVMLHDLATGRLLAVLDASRLTAVRTGAAAALSADVLANPDAGDLAIIGAGAQGEMALGCLGSVRRLRRVRVYDTVPAKAAAFCERLASAAPCALEPAASVAAAVAGADLVLTATWSQQPFLTAGMLAPGAHVVTLGPDQPGKAELSADAIRRGLFVCDDRDLAVEMGAIGGVGLDQAAIHAELGEIIAGRKPGRTSPQQVTIFGSVGLAIQDLAAAWLVVERARPQGRGMRIDFLG
jgi:ornithine cyclodeaminase/alanine dehydrogenase-like protein (mu-crystallin family)